MSTEGQIDVDREKSTETAAILTCPPFSATKLDTFVSTLVKQKPGTRFVVKVVGPDCAEPVTWGGSFVKTSHKKCVVHFDIDEDEALCNFPECVMGFGVIAEAAMVDGVSAEKDERFDALSKSVEKIIDGQGTLIAHITRLTEDTHSFKDTTDGVLKEFSAQLRTLKATTADLSNQLDGVRKKSRAEDQDPSVAQALNHLSDTHRMLIDKQARRTTELVPGVRVPMTIDEPFDALYPHVHWGNVQEWKASILALFLHLGILIKTPALRQEFDLARDSVLSLSKSPPPTSKQEYRIAFEQCFVMVRIIVKCLYGNDQAEKARKKLLQQWNDGAIDLEKILKESAPEQDQTETAALAAKGERTNDTLVALANLQKSNESLRNDIVSIASSQAQMMGRGYARGSFHRYRGRGFRGRYRGSSSWSSGPA